MTFLGKIFTVLILLLSVIYMSFAVCVFATHTRWKEVVMRPDATDAAPLGLKFQVEAQQKRIRELVEEIGRVQGDLALEKGARRHIVATISSQLLDAQTQLADTQTLLESKDDQLRVSVKNAELATMTLASLTDEVADLRQEVLDTTESGDRKYQRLLGLADSLHNAEGVITSLTDKNLLLAGSVGKLKRVMRAHGIRENDPIDDTPPPLDGIITAIDSSDLVEISIGSDDGIREGNKLDVFRGNKYIGRIVVTKAASDLSVARIIPEYVNGRVRRNDKVATKIRS